MERAKRRLLCLLLIAGIYIACSSIAATAAQPTEPVSYRLSWHAGDTDVNGKTVYGSTHALTALQRETLCSQLYVDKATDLFLKHAIRPQRDYRSCAADTRLGAHHRRITLPN